MNVRELSISGVKLIEPVVHHDDRGFFCETYSAKALRSTGIDVEFVQDNHSLSKDKGVVRGLHFQTPPFAQGKLVRVVRGAILDIAVDIRRGSPTFGRHVSATLSAENFRQMWVPEGFAHGFCTLVPETEVVYKVTNDYAPDCDRGFQWNDAALGIDWPVDPTAAILSAKDAALPLLQEIETAFVYSGPGR